MIRLLIGTTVFMALAAAASADSNGVNLLVNGSFEEPVVDNINTNNLGTIPTGWSQTGADGTWNLIRNDGSVYGNGVDSAVDGSQIIDLNGQFEIFQNFTLAGPESLVFGASFANRAGHSGEPSTVGIYDAEGETLLSPEISVDTSDEPQPSEVWLSGEATVELQAGEYQIRIALNNFNNVDAVCVASSGPPPDEDNDGLPDSWETTWFGNLSRNGSGDFDGDGLNDADELSNQTNPTEKDTDADGLEDGPEVSMHGSDPTEVDTDGDTLNDFDEVTVFMTNPAEADSDGDGVIDPVEVNPEFASDPNDLNSVPDVIVASNSGPWMAPSTWGGEAPVAGRKYAALAGVSDELTTTEGAFAGDSLTLIGAKLVLAANSSTAVLTVSNGTIELARSSTLGGRVTLVGDSLIDVGSSTLTLEALLAGTDGATFTGGTVDSPEGGVEIDGPFSQLSGDININGTSVSLLSANGLSGGPGNIYLRGGGLSVESSSTYCGELLINGDNFVLALGAELELKDLKGLDGDGNVSFSLHEAAGNVSLTADDLVNSGFAEEQVTGAGLLTLNDAVACPEAECDSESDADGDGVNDCVELLEIGTDLNNPDTDGDGVNDGDELASGTNPKREDSDEDGLNDGQEKDLGTDPLLGDTDGDGFSDSREVELGQDPLVPNAGANLLVNGSFEEPVLDNINTNNLGTIPTGWSQTGADATWNLIRNDGSAYGSGVDMAADEFQIIDLNGAFELFQNFTLGNDAALLFGASFANREGHDGSDPSTVGIYDAAGENLLSPEVAVDTSEDPTPSEVWRSGDATVNLPAGDYQIRIDLNNFNNVDAVFVIAGGGPQTQADTDGDGVSDELEEIAGTDPNDATSYLRVTSVRSEGESPAVTWSAVDGRSYDVYHSVDLVEWTKINADPIVGVEGNATYTDTDATRNDGAVGFYRAQVLE